MWCLGRVCRPVADLCPTNQFLYRIVLNLVLLNNLWIQDMKKLLWWQIRLTLNIFWQISSSPPSIFLDLLLELVVARITHVALPLRADWKINWDHRARLVSSNRDWFAYYTNILIILYFTHSLHVFAGETIMPPRVLASGPKPCRGN